MKNLKENTPLVVNFRELDTRFGRLTINLDKEVTFSRGIIGLPSLKKYALIDLPSQIKFDNFKILQSIEDESISFITLPISKDKDNLFGGLIKEEDILQGCDFLKIKYEDLAVILIVNFKKSVDQGIAAFLNLRAPILIDSKTLEGFQYILSNNSYEVSKRL